MKLFVPGLFACAALAAGMVLTGCGSPSQDQSFGSKARPALSSGPSAAGNPASDMSVARFRVGDPVIVSFSGTPVPITPYEETIKEDGTITPPYIGSIYAAGKTAGELQRELYTNYVPKYYVRITVTVKSGDRVFYVGGQVGHAGVFQYVSDTTVTKAIQAAGGLNDFANHGKVYLIRATTGQRIRVNYDEALKDPAKDPAVYPDDQVNVDKRIF